MLELGELRLECIEFGVRSVVVLPARVGVRTKPVVKITPARTVAQPADAPSANAWDRGPTTRGPKELRVEVTNDRGDAPRLLEMLRSVVALPEEANA